jgi:hypothetical protein
MCHLCERSADADFERVLQQLIQAGHVEVKTDSRGRECYRLTALGALIKQIEDGETGQVGTCN